LGFAEGQPESIVEDIENMVRSYVEKVRIISNFLVERRCSFICARCLENK
jgi:hypothetical protein